MFTPIALLLLTSQTAFGHPGMFGGGPPPDFKPPGGPPKDFKPPFDFKDFKPPNWPKFGEMFDCLGKPPKPEDLPPPLAIDKSKCVCDLMADVFKVSAKLDLNMVVLELTVTPVKPNPTLLDSLSAKIEASVELNKPPVKALLDLMGKNDLAGLKVILEAVLQGKVQTVVDLVAMLKEKSPGVYEVVITLMMSLQVNFEATVNLLGPKPASLMMTLIADLKASVDVKVMMAKLAAMDKGALAELILSIKAVYPQLVDSLSLGPPPPVTPPPVTPPPSTPPTTPATPPMPPPFPLPEAIVKILLDLQAKVKVDAELKALLAKLQIDVNLNVDVMIKKLKANLPDLLAKLMVLVKQKDIDGLVALLKDIKSGKVTIVAQALAQLQGEAPGIFKLIVSISAQLKLTASVFMGALEPPQKDLLAKLGAKIVDAAMEIKAVLEANKQLLMDALLKAVPQIDALLKIEIKLDVKASLTALFDAVMAKIVEPAKVLADLPVDQAQLDVVISGAQANLPALLKMILGKLTANDVEGAAQILIDAMANKFTSVLQLTAELKAKAPALVELAMQLLAILKVALNDVILPALKAVDQKIVDLAKQIAKLIVKLLMALLKLLKEAKPEDIAKILDAIVKAIPKLEPLINTIKMYISIIIKIQIEGGLTVPPPPATTPTAPTTPTTPPPEDDPYVQFQKMFKLSYKVQAGKR